MTEDNPSVVPFYYDFVSPATYLAFCDLNRFSREHSVSFEMKPVLLGGIHKAVEHRAAVMQGGAKVQWMLRDLQRTARRLGAEFSMNRHFPFSTVSAMRGACVAKARGELEPYNDAMFSAVWRDQLNLSDPAVMASVIESAGLDAQTYAAEIVTPEVKEELKAATTEAINVGVFGCPSFLVNGEVVFGQDRMHVVAEILAES
ncbi:MAG: 2-hydroxychromene-2-carboxylate isomerase [Myxococcota bacterium]